MAGEVSIRAVLQGFDQAKSSLADLGSKLDEVKAKAAGSADGSNAATSALGDLAAAGNDTSATLQKLVVAAEWAGAALGTGFVAAAGLAFGKLKDAVTDLEKTGDALFNLSQRTGIAASTLSEMTLVANVSGISINEYGTAMEHLSRSMAKAGEDGATTGGVFERLGISVRDAEGNMKSADQVMNEMADKFSGMADGANKTDIAIEAMSRTGAAMIPVLNQGSAGLNDLRDAARQAGVVISDETAEAANKLNESLSILSAYSKGFWAQIAAPIVEGMSQVAQAMVLARREGEGFFGAMLRGAQEALIQVFQPTVQGLTKDIAQLSAEMERVRSAPFFDGAQYSALAARMAPLTEQLKALQAVAGVNTAGAKPDAPGRSGKAKSSGNAVTDHEDTIDQIIAGEQRMWAEMAKLGDIGLDDYKSLLEDELTDYNLNEAQKLGIRVKIQDAQQAIDRQQAESDKAINDENLRAEAAYLAQGQENFKIIKAARKEEADQIRENQKATEDQAKAELDAINTTVYWTREAKLVALEELRQKYIDLGADGTKAVKDITKEIQKMPTDADDAARRMKSIFGNLSFDVVNVFSDIHRSLASNIADVLKGTETVADGVRNVFKSMVNAVINEFARLAANQIMLSVLGMSGMGGAGGAVGGMGGSAAAGGGIMSVIGNLFGGGGGSGGGLLSSIFGGGGGGGGGGLAGGSGSASGGFGGIFDPILTGVSNLGSGLQSGLGSIFQNIGVSTGSQTVADVGNWINGLSGGEGLGYLGAAVQLAQGNFGGAAGTALGTAIGAYFGVPGIGGAVGGFLGNAVGGLFGGSGTYATGDGYRITGTVDATGFHGTYLALAHNGGDQYADNVTAAVTPGLNAVIQPIFSAHYPSNASIPINITAPLYHGVDAVAQFLTQNAPVIPFATGGESIVTRPQLFMAGEQGAERVSVTPLSGAHLGRTGGGITNIFNGPTMMDAYSSKLFMNDMRRQLGIAS